MAYEMKEGSGSLFKNDRKEKDTHPDRTGSAKIGGVDYWVSGWIKQDRNGKPYLSMAFKPKDDGAQSGSLKDEMSDEIPF